MSGSGAGLAGSRLEMGQGYHHLLYGPGRRSRARTRGADIGEGGRRGVGEQEAGVERDWEGGEGVDLPAYDKHGGPPVYSVEVLPAGTGAEAQEVRRSVSISRGNGESAETPSTPVPAPADPPSYPGPPTLAAVENPFSTQEDSEQASTHRYPTRATVQRSQQPVSNNRSSAGGERVQRPRPAHTVSPSMSMMPGSLSNW
ncbi:hypothetical protein V5O48_010637 [Marasmius crinis-equi]|uniref:Uncharacterized protein n=3 Tax=Marasmius crinis-equi TaxID=585013 RepID=A0ABR3F7S8_9AGAR